MSASGAADMNAVTSGRDPVGLGDRHREQTRSVWAAHLDFQVLPLGFLGRSQVQRDQLCELAGILRPSEIAPPVIVIDVIADGYIEEKALHWAPAWLRFYADSKTTIELLRCYDHS